MGAALPEKHSAVIVAHYRQPPERIFDTILDVEAAPSWRTGLDSVRILEREARPLRWREYSSFGTLDFVLEEVEPPRRIVSRIATVGEGFGGSWTYEILPAPEGAVVTFTEDGEVYSPLFRFMSRFVFGHYRTLEQYARDLGARFGETVQPERVTH